MNDMYVASYVNELTFTLLHQMPLHKFVTIIIFSVATQILCHCYI